MTGARGSSGLFKADDFEPTELDRAILALVPNEGERRGRFFHEMSTAVQLFRELNDEYLSSSLISGRLKILKDHGFLVAIKPTSANTPVGYQRTQKGREAAADN